VTVRYVCFTNKRDIPSPCTGGTNDKMKAIYSN